jgi:hypothetical protein
MAGWILSITEILASAKESLFLSGRSSNQRLNRKLVFRLLNPLGFVAFKLALLIRVETLMRVLAISVLSFCLPLIAQEESGWELDSLQGKSSVSKPDAQQVYEVLLKMLDRWNAHDIDGHLEVYWKSPELLVVVDSEQFNGWQQLHDSYINGYPDRHAMGFIQPKRIQVKMLKPDLALALTWWSVAFPSSKQNVVGNSTMNLQKFSDGWKIVASHTSIAAM